MAFYSQDAFTFEAPFEWSDTTSFSFRGKGKVAPTIVVSRNPLFDTEGLETLVSRKLFALGKTADFALLSWTDHPPVADRAAVLLRFRFTGPPGTLEQRMVVVDAPRGPHRLATLVSLATLVDDDGVEEAEEVFRRVVGSLRFEPLSNEVPLAVPRSSMTVPSALGSSPVVALPEPVPMPGFVRVQKGQATGR